MTIPLIIGGVLLAILILLILVFITKYRTVGPDEALIVTGNWLGGGKNVVTTMMERRLKLFEVAVLRSSNYAKSRAFKLLNYN